MSKRLLYFHNGLSSFVQKDIDILNSEFDLKTHFFQVKNKKKVPFSFISQKLFLFRYLFTSQIFVVKFGGYH